MCNVLVLIPNQNTLCASEDDHSQHVLHTWPPFSAFSLLAFTLAGSLMDWVVREGSTELPQDVVYNGRLLNFPQEPLQTLHYRKMMGRRGRESERGTKLKLEVQKIQWQFLTSIAKALIPATLMDCFIAMRSPFRS